MRAVIQRVSKATVVSDGFESGAIKHGLVVLVGFEESDTREDVEWMAGKISRLRLFDDSDDVMNLSVIDVDGEVLIVSQFTLHAKTKKGNRPSYIMAARPDVAIPLYEYFIDTIEGLIGKPAATGVFGAKMNVSLVNDGPVTILIDTKNKE